MDENAVVEAAIARARAELMAGYGPGATPLQVYAWTRGRHRIAGEAVPVRRQAIADHTALARRDATAIAESVVRTRQEIAASEAELSARLAPTGALRRSRLFLIAGAALGAAALVMKRIRGHRATDATAGRNTRA